MRKCDSRRTLQLVGLGTLRDCVVKVDAELLGSIRRGFRPACDADSGAYGGKLGGIIAVSGIECRRREVVAVDTALAFDVNVHGRERGRAESLETAGVERFVEREGAVRVSGVASRDKGPEVCRCLGKSAFVSRTCEG